MKTNGLKLIFSVFLALILAGCGTSGTDGGTNGTKSISKGKITNKTSTTTTSRAVITVNKTQFSTATADIVTEDNSGGLDSDIVVGMVVKVTSEDGVVEEIEYDEEMEGPIEMIISAAGADVSFKVLGTIVNVDANTVYGKNDGNNLASVIYRVEDIIMHDVVEVSGFYQMDGSLLATYIEMNGTHPANKEAEIKGVIEVGSLTGSAPDFQFTVLGATIKTKAATTYEGFPGDVPTEGTYVEVEGILETIAGVTSFTTIVASEIENETEDEGSEVEVEGIVTGYDMSNTTFMVNGIKVDASSATIKFLDPATTMIADGMKVEAEGSMVGGVLVATQVEEESIS